LLENEGNTYLDKVIAVFVLLFN